MQVVMFYHSLVSDWNHGNAHFLRGVVARAARARPRRRRLRAGRRLEPREPRRRARRAAARATSRRVSASCAAQLYDLDELDLDARARRRRPRDRARVERSGARAPPRRASRALASFRLLFHDTHHRSVDGAARRWRATTCADYDGVLAFGERDPRALPASAAGRARAWTWHEAADVRLFRPLPDRERAGDLVWIGNWGDGERTRGAAASSCSSPCRRLGLTARVYGVRYPPERARGARARPGIDYRGWLPNYAVPEVFARHRVTVHVPRRPYARGAAGHPDDPRRSRRWPAASRSSARRGTTPRACSRPGDDLSRRARRRRDARAPARGAATTASSRARSPRTGAQTILARHTCAHRVDELLAIAERARRRAHASRGGHGGAAIAAMRIAFFGSSLVSAYWNGAATYYRGIVRALHGAGIASRSTSRTHSSASSTATSPIRPGRRSSSTRPSRRTALRARSSRRAAPTSSSRPAASACSTSCSSARCWSCSGRRRWCVLGRRCARDAGARRSRDAGRSVPRADPALRSGSHLRRRRAGRARATARSARATACRSTTRSIRRRTIPVRAAIRASPATWLPRQPPARPRGARGGVLPARRGAAAASDASCSAAAAGTTSRCRRTSATSATSTPRITTRSTARRSRC